MADADFSKTLGEVVAHRELAFLLCCHDSLEGERTLELEMCQRLWVVVSE